jgi:2-polyprenyl-3-methyl-5-hydroxy-6-metoxy-1,4-benzoquinol methylase
MEKVCLLCQSKDVVVLNTYKHHCIVCNDCNNVSHIKKRKYLFDYFLPKSLMRKLLPSKAFYRLFSHDEFVASEFYDVYASEALNLNEWRKSEFNQITHELEKGGVDYRGKSILDISGGPGLVASQFSELASSVTVTEFSKAAVEVMEKVFKIDCRVFDYNANSIDEVFQDKKFDIILVRSSIIFCEKLDDFISKLYKILNENGIVLIETILPTYGEIFWWQQLEHKFPFIYSQETIEKLFYKNKFSFMAGFRDYGSYFGVKNRSYDTKSKYFFTWAIEFPMLLLYLVPALFKRSAMDQSLKHKMITMLWQKNGISSNALYENFSQGDQYKSKTFGYVYNNYLKNKN